MQTCLPFLLDSSISVRAKPSAVPVCEPKKTVMPVLFSFSASASFFFFFFPSSVLLFTKPPVEVDTAAPIVPEMKYAILITTAANPIVRAR